MRNYKFKVTNLKKKDKELKKIFKKCKCCNEVLLTSKFSKRKVSKDGYRNECQKCCYDKNKVRHTCICQQCGKEFPSMIKDAKFCDQKCMGKWKSEYMTGENAPHTTEKIYKPCDKCGKIIEILPSQYERAEHHFCSKECHDEWQKGRPHTDEHKEAISKGLKENPPMLGKHHTDETRKKISEALDGKYTGENSPNWNPNITDEEREKGRNIQGLPQWRNEVYERDNYACQCCGDNKGGNLNAHHINGYNWCKEGRTDVNNGICLCEECHKEYHKIYGKGNNTWQQFREFLYNKYLQTNNLYFLALIETIDLRLIQLNNKAS